MRVYAERDDGLNVILPLSIYPSTICLSFNMLSQCFLPCDVMHFVVDGMAWRIYIFPLSRNYFCHKLLNVVASLWCVRNARVTDVECENGSFRLYDAAVEVFPFARSVIFSQCRMHVHSAHIILLQLDCNIGSYVPCFITFVNTHVRRNIINSISATRVKRTRVVPIWIIAAHLNICSIINAWRWLYI